MDGEKSLHLCSGFIPPATQELRSQDFPGGPVVKTWPANAGGVGSIPGQGTKIHMPRGQKTTTENQRILQQIQ